MESDAKQALVAGLYALSRIQRGAPNLAEQDSAGGSMVLGLWEQVLDHALPTVTAAEIVAACQAITEAGPFFPAPAELIEQVRQIRRQRALGAQERRVERRLALLPAPESGEAAQARQEALERIQGILSDLAAKMTALPRALPRGGAAQLDAEVARLRALEGKPLRAIGGGKA